MRLSASLALKTKKALQKQGQIWGRVDALAQAASRLLPGRRSRAQQGASI